MSSRPTRSAISIALLTTLSASLLSAIPVAANAAPGASGATTAEPRTPRPARITEVARVELKERATGKPTKVAAPALSQTSTETSSSSPGRASGPQASALAPTSTFVVNYSGFTAEQQASYQSAIDVLKTLIVAPQPIVIDASFAALPAGVVGSAGPTYLEPIPDSSTQGHTFYPAALANQKTNSDTDPTLADVETRFGTAFNSQWYFGTGTAPSNLIDFKSVVMHEVWHGLGFLGTMDVRNGLGSYGSGTPIPAVYDRFTTNTAGVPLLNGSAFPNGSAALAGQLTGGALQFVGANTRRSNGGASPRLYAPGTWEPGSSYAHLNETTFPAGNPNSLLTPSIGAGEVIHSPGPIALGIFRDMGWNTKIVPAAPVAPTATAGVGSATVTWTAPDNGGDTISSYVVTPSTGSPVTLAGTATSTTFNNLAAGTPVSFTVKAINGIGSSPVSASSAAVTPTATPTAPSAPTAVSATAGNAAAQVSWSAAASNGSAISGYTVTSSPGGLTASVTGTATSASVTGLTNGTAYTFTVRATNATGVGPASGASSPVTPFVPSAPTAPTAVTATASNASAQVRWTASPSTGGAITGYTVTSSPGAKTCTTTSLSCIVQGLTNGTGYTFTVVATNAVGNSPASAASSSVTASPDAIERYVTKVYNDLFDRNPDPGGLAGWTTALRGGSPYGDVANGITYSAEFRSGLIAGSYQRYLGRSPDQGGLDHWLRQMGAGLQIEQMEAGFISSLEFYQRSGSNDRQWVADLYQSVLGRSAGTNEIDYWVGQLRLGAGHANVAAGFLYSTEHLSSIVDGYYLDLLRRNVDPSGISSWVTAIQRGSRDEQIIASIVSSAEYRQNV